ncbi:hypothetical protein PENSPDRAFT_646742 [Peniophora sp. CONT]|nr:hypothetical protein PENSPDRAFT_646742 [Peniophora sp. CONT]
MFHEQVTCYYWVVGFLDEEERFHKISVLEMDDDDWGNPNRELCEVLGLSRGYDEELGSPWIRRVKLVQRLRGPLGHTVYVASNLSSHKATNLSSYINTWHEPNLASM